MREEQHKEWLLRIKNIMIGDGETEEFVEFATDWFSGFKCRDEIDLIESYHPYLKHKSEEVIYEFINNARYPLFEDTDFFDIQCFDSAFFLYRALLKMKYLEEERY